MSHFTVLVAAKDQKELEARLLPYHEYECTGIEEYLQWVPEDMVELREKFLEYNSEGKTFEEWIPDWCSAQKNEAGEWGRYTNPNAKWDWWLIGGRWTGMLKLKPEFWGKGENGKPGIMAQPNADPRYCDGATKGAIDWAAMRQEDEEKSRARYRRWKQIHEAWPQIPDPEREPEKTSQYRKDLHENNFILVRQSEVEDFTVLSEEQYVAKYATRMAVTFAYVDQQGVWHERAEMGWFGATRNERDNYDQELWTWLESLPDDQGLYVVDCHI